jgi:hypothetical protein
LELVLELFGDESLEFKFTVESDEFFFELFKFQ